MGEAKRRGDFEQRFSDAKIREARQLAEITEARRQAEIQKIKEFEALPEADKQQLLEREERDQLNRQRLRLLLVSALTVGMR